MVERELRVAVVGLGKIGLLHASLLNAMPGVQLVALCDRNTMIRGARYLLQAHHVTRKLGIRCQA